MRRHLKFLPLIALIAIVALLPSPASAGLVLDIQFTGLNVTYDGTAFTDAVANTSGSGDPLQSDPLLSMKFVLDGALVGTLDSNLWADIYLPVTNIPTNGAKAGTGGIFDLLTQDSVPGWGLALDVDEFLVTYANLGGQKAMTVLGTASFFNTPNLPFGLSHQRAHHVHDLLRKRQLHRERRVPRDRDRSGNRQRGWRGGRGSRTRHASAPGQRPDRTCAAPPAPRLTARRPFGHPARGFQAAGLCFSGRRVRPRLPSLAASPARARSEEGRSRSPARGIARSSAG